MRVDFSTSISENRGQGQRSPNHFGASKTVAGIDPKYYYLTLGLLGLCTLVGLIVAYSFQRDVNEGLAPPTEKDLFGPLEKAYYSGLMDEAEFKRIQESMARQKGEEAVPASKRMKPQPKPLEAPPTTPHPETELEEETESDEE
jgi:hypothetical protein